MSTNNYLIKNGIDATDNYNENIVIVNDGVDVEQIHSDFIQIYLKYMYIYIDFNLSLCMRAYEHMI